MKTFIIFVTDQDIDKEDKTDTLAYYRTLPGMLRNYLGNCDKIGRFTRSYGYIGIDPDKVSKTNIIETVTSLKNRLPDGFTDYKIPVIIDTSKTEYNVPDNIVAELADLEKELIAVDGNFSFLLLKNTIDNRLVNV